MSKAEKAEQRALEAYPVLMCYNDFQMVEEDINKPLRKIYQEGYRQAEEDVVESFARIIRGNLSMIDKSVQDMFEQLYTDITGEKMYKGFKD